MLSRPSPLRTQTSREICLADVEKQYGDLFSFILLGRKVTVALGPKGNNLSLGGKISQVSAEDAYTVCVTIHATRQNVAARG